MIEKAITLPAVRGVQAGRIYYSAMVEVDTAIDLFMPIDPKLPPEERLQRALSKARVPDIAEYVVNNPDTYIFSSLVSAADGEAPVWTALTGHDKLGFITLPVGLLLYLLDGQHRRAGLEEARRRVAQALARAAFLKEDINVLIFLDPGLAHARTHFRDLNHGVPPNASLKLLFNERDETAELARYVMKKIPKFGALVDGEMTSAAGNSSKLFGFKSLHAACRTVAEGVEGTPPEVRTAVCAYWTALFAAMPAWREAAEGSVVPAELREKYVHAHGVTLQALGALGKGLLTNHKGDWQKKLGLLERVNWDRMANCWNGRCVVLGKMTINARAISLTENVLRVRLGMPLSVAGRAAEKALTGKEALKL